MADQERIKFVSLLAKELKDGSVHLPSLPDVVIKIRDLLEQDRCDFKQVSQVVSMDPALVSRLLVFANSAYHNRGEARIENVDAAIGRLGFETVRNTALSMAVKQLYLAKQHKNILEPLRRLWLNSMKLSSMSLALGKLDSELNEETAFMCGLLHEVGKLYILTKVKDFPEFLGVRETLDSVLEEWHPQVGRCIVEDWGFPDEVVKSVEPQEFIDKHTHLPPSMADVLLVASLMLEAGESQVLDYQGISSAVKLGITDEALPSLWDDYKEQLASVGQAMKY